MNRMSRLLAVGISSVYLVACQDIMPLVVTAPAPIQRHAPQAPPVGGDGAEDFPDPTRPSALISIDDYKTRVAERIVNTNPGLIFSGRLPPMLPAVVVLTISVDQNGALSHVVVQRSRSSEASEIALMAVQHGAPFPKPQQLLHRGHKTLDFSETFLFGDDEHFKVRTLAGPQ